MREYNPPYHSAEMDQKLMALFGKAGVRVDDSPRALRDISVVGGLLFLNHELYRDDTDTVVGAAKMISDSGLSIHRDSAFHFYNLLPPVESDFLQAANPYIPEDEIYTKPSDIVVVSYVYGGSPLAAGYDLLPAYARKGYASYRSMLDSFMEMTTHVHPLTAVSFLQEDSSSWRRSAAATGAKFVATRGGETDEVSTDCFKGKEFRILIDTRENHRVGGAGSLGIAMTTDATFKDSIASIVHGENMLGRRILGEKPPKESAPDTRSTLERAVGAQARIGRGPKRDYF